MKIYTIAPRLVLAFLLAWRGVALADEGMWLPLLLKQLNEKDMQAQGCRLTAEQIYSINQGSLKDAVLQFNGGCTGEMISPDGLFLTNHHCGFSQIQAHSSVENDYITNGFWAKNRSEEKLNPGVTATFIVRMEDVTEKVLKGVSLTTDEVTRNRLITKNSQQAIAEAIAGTHYEGFVRPFYYGNEYYLFITETFRDVRLVGAPPNSIGSFGGDTDNWVWPRHSADFAMFRIYAGKDNKPAEYSPENVPFKPRHYLPISLKGVKEGDFTMVYGFPGRTQEYLSSYGVQLVQDVQDPIRIAARTKRLGIWEDGMKADAATRIQYAAKYASVANGWKKWQGEIRGLKISDVVTKKQQQESEFTRRVSANPAWSATYGQILPRMKTLYTEARPYIRQEEFISETLRGVEAVRLAGNFFQLEHYLQEKLSDSIRAEANRIKALVPAIYKDYNPSLDAQVAFSLWTLYCDSIPAANRIAFFQTPENALEAAAKGFEAFQTSIFTNRQRLEAFLTAPTLKKLQQDPLFVIFGQMQRYYETEVQAKGYPILAEIELLQRTYMRAQREVFAEKTFYPDANSTLRLTYGKMQGYSPADGLAYTPFTTMAGIFEKNLSGNPDYALMPRQWELWNAKNYGRYADGDGSLHTCFVARNHTTGGNSGSPVINADGHLIGINFDRVWEGTMSDINYDTRMCRNIAADIRYILWVTDVYAGAGYLLKEMTIIE